MLPELEELRYRNVPEMVQSYVAKSAKQAAAVQHILLKYPQAGVRGVDYAPYEEKLAVTATDSVLDVEPKLIRELEGIAPIMGKEGASIWVPLFFRPYTRKEAGRLPGLGKADIPDMPEMPGTRDIARGVGQTALAFDSPVSKYIPGAPSPLAATIAGGVLGAGAGYGTGWLLNKIQPKDWQKERTRRLAMLLGAGLGAAPGLVGMGFHHANGVPITDPGPLGGSPTPFDPAFKYKSKWPTYKAAEKVIDVELDAEHAKIARAYTGAGGPSVYVPTGYIPYDAFNATVWNDPRVADKLPAGQQAALSGLMTGASHVSNTPKFISPMDIAKVTMGMGSGYVSGAIVGKALGLMTGMSPSSQEKLKNTGVWAGLLANMVPIAFGR